MNPMNPFASNIELEEIKIKDPNSSQKDYDSSKIIDESQSYTSGSFLNKPSSKYTPTITSVISRKKKKKEGFSEIDETEYDSEEEDDKKARINRNLTQATKDKRTEEEKPTRIGVGEEEECDDFDWFADDYITNDREKEDEKSDDEDSKESGLIHKFSKIPKAVRYWTWLIIGDVIFAVPIILSFALDCIESKKSDNLVNWEAKSDCKGWLRNASICGHHISKWALWAIPSWSVYWLLKIFVHLIPGFVIRVVDFTFGYVSKKILNFADYIRFLQKYVVYAISSFISYIFLRVFVPKNDSKSLDFIYSLILSIFVSCAIWAVEKIILQSFSISFHKSVYEERIEEINQAITVLEYLNESRHKNIKTEVSPNNSKIGLNNYVDNGFYSKVAKMAKNVVGKKATTTKSVLLRSSWDAKMLARNLYYHLGGTDRPQDELTVENFKEFFITEQEAQDAFDLFDKDGNGDLSKSEIKSFVLEVYQEQKTLRKSMKDSNIALRKLDYLFKTISVIIIIIAILTIFDCDLSSVYVAISSIWVGVMFAISGTITSLVQSLIFLFITHPFDVGDRIEIDGQAYLVKDFGLTNVTMKKPNGEEIYAPTSELTSKFINNIRRSSPLIQVFNIAVNSKNTTAEQIQSLQDRLQAFIEKESRHFQGRCIVTATDILDELRMNLAILVQHKHNGQDALRVRQRNDLFVSEIKNSINLLNIQLPNPSLLIINIANEDGEMMPYETHSIE
ncbi:hypothetical protein BCR36DRAFT_397185 [Piromyces finnis]|uniref:EF-hand domain-containing protein n=1 Tax=Piromyces finnis TaxID=1754191 RepID=A0A1Y1VCS8_9FUNG|nr:hypothetical protein BCR36DRAFT_397185 [Piromyces finnis]|eukprot:ORX51459.1 hypothetical protein BCR36DRAFT_397185 [Piromyces finnis]